VAGLLRTVEYPHPGPARSGPKGGRPRRHGGVLTFAKPDSWHQSDVTTAMDTTRYGKAEAMTRGRMHPRLTHRGPWLEHTKEELPALHGTLVRLTVERLPGNRDPKPVWLRCSANAATPVDVALVAIVPPQVRSFGCAWPSPGPWHVPLFACRGSLEVSYGQGPLSPKVRHLPFNACRALPRRQQELSYGLPYKRDGNFRPFGKFRHVSHDGVAHFTAPIVESKRNEISVIHEGENSDLEVPVSPHHQLMIGKS
jgi:hypothetical protein